MFSSRNDKLIIHEHPKLDQPKMMLGFSGWMNNGDVSTGTATYFADKLDVDFLAEINSEDFYILNMPGPIELTANYRPLVTIDNGVITEIEIPENTFYYDLENNLIIFLGSEPNLGWMEYADCIFDLADKFNVSMIYSIGSVGGPIPHTRHPRLKVHISDETLRPGLRQLGVEFSSYSGPSGISSYLTKEASNRGFPMATVVAEIPPYVHGRNDLCVEYMVKTLCGLLMIYVDHADLQQKGEMLEKKLNDALNEYPELVKRIKELEDNYDREMFDVNMDEMKQWLAQRGIRLD